jgi:hypothetical protein
MTIFQERIYLNPPRYWAATRNMNEEDTEEFTNEILRLAAEGNLEELKQYDFISFGHRRAMLVAGSQLDST